MGIADWMATVPGLEEIEALADSLPEPVTPCPDCGGSGWRMIERRDIGQLRVIRHHWDGGVLVACDCRRETGGG